MRPSKQGEAWWENFQALLDEQNQWPAEYVFKFIAPLASLDDLKAVFGRHPIAVRSSSKGNYYSVTARMHVHSSEEIIALYKAAADVDGVISL